jgi:hypothetical protein
MKFIFDPNYPPKHQLTSEEKSFLQKLAGYKLMLDKSLCFQINDLQQHTRLVLSGYLLPRKKFSSAKKKEKEIAELDAIIAEHSDKLERGEIPKENLRDEKALLNLWKKQRTELKKALDNPAGDMESGSYFGRYLNKGDKSIVVLFVDAIAAEAKNPYDTMLLMGQVLLHEYFHSFYYHAGGGSRMAIKCVEEPMAEFGSLVVLDNVISKEAIDAYYYALNFIREKQNCVGITAAYGFGVYLFKKYKKDFRNLIARYANVSRLFDEHASEVKAYKYLLYPIYPSFESIEDKTYERLEDLLKSGEAKVNLL